MLEHVLRCKKGWRRRHDLINRVWAQAMGQVTKSRIFWNPNLRPVPPDMTFEKRSTTTLEGAQTDLAIRDFWGDGRWNHFDTRVFDPSCPSYQKFTPSGRHNHHETEKKTKYEERVQRVDGGSFTPLVASVFGTLAPASRAVVHRLVALRCQEKGEWDETRFGREVFVEKTRIQMGVLRAVAEVLGMRPGVEFEVEKKGGRKFENGRLSGGVTRWI